MNQSFWAKTTNISRPYLPYIVGFIFTLLLDPSLTLCLVRVILERMENIGRKSGWKTVFSTVWQRVKNTEDGKPGRKFSLPSHKSHPPKSGGKLWREKCSHNQITEMPSLTQRSLQLSKEEDNFPTTYSAQFIITTTIQK